MTTFAQLRGDHPLVVYIDLKSPYAYLAIDPTRAMARAAGVPIEWRPFTLDIPSYLGSAKLDDTRKKVASSERSDEQWSGVKYSYMDARRYANLTGKTVRGTIKIWDSSFAGIAMLWAKRHDAIDRYLDHVYPPFWRRELDIEDPTVIEATLRDAGISAEGFREFLAGPGRVEHDATNREAFDAGIFGVPTYLVGDERWFGREHLPRVSWLLGGSHGPTPDVGNRSFEPDAAEPSVEPGRHLTILLDVRHPESYLALGPALRFERELGLQIDWLPLAAPTLRRPTEPAADDDRSVRHRRSRAQAVAAEVETYARAQGLHVREIHRDPDPRAFHLGWLWLRRFARESLPAFLTEGFRAYWSCELDPGDLAQVAALVASVPGGDRLAFEAWSAAEGPAEADALAADLARAGRKMVPGYVVEDEFFWGRQHLAMIRWILGGRRGRGPI